MKIEFLFYEVKLHNERVFNKLILDEIIYKLGRNGLSFIIKFYQ